MPAIAQRLPCKSTLVFTNWPIIFFDDCHYILALARGTESKSTTRILHSEEKFLNLKS